MLQPCEAVGQSLDDGTCAEIAASDACYNHNVAVLAQHLCSGIDVGNELLGDRRRQMQPAQEVIALAGAVLQSLACSLGFGFISENILF